MRRRRRFAVTLLASALLLTGPAISQARPPSSLPGNDISASELGRDLAAEASARYRSYGVEAGLNDLKVMDLGDGNILIAPAAAADVVATLDADGPGYEISTTVGHTLDAPEGVAMAADGDVVLAAAAYWSRRESGCFTRWWVDSAYMDTCYEISKLINDNDGTQDFWGLEHWSTVGETQWGLRDAWINGTRLSGSTWQNWYRWSPGSDLSGGCRNVNVSVTVLSASLGATFQTCETWDMTKSANGSNVSYKQHWKCMCSFMSFRQEVWKR